MVILFVVIPVVATVIGVGWWKLTERQAAEAIRGAWDQVSACLLGAPLSQAERASGRMRAIQLTAVRAEREIKVDGQRWPVRCADDVARLYEALRRHGRDKDGPEGLARRAEDFAPVLRKAEVMQDLSAPVDALFEAAARFGLSAQPATVPVAPPAPAQALTVDSLGEGARLSALQYTLERVSAPPHLDTSLHLLFHDPRLDPKPLVCTFTPAGADRCRTVAGAAEKKSSFTLGGTTEEGASPLLFAGRDGEDGILRSDGGTEVATLRAESAYVAKDGYVAIAGFPTDEKGTFELLQQRSVGAPLERLTIEPDMFEPKVAQLHRRMILWDKLLVQVLDEDDTATPRLLALQLPLSGKKPKFQPVAPLDWVNARIVGCRTADTTVVRIGIDRGFLTFFRDGSWSTPVAADGFPPAFGCDRSEAIFTSAWGGQRRCTPAGCQESEGAEPTFEPFPQREGALADLGGRILAVALTDKRGGVRYRYADGKNLGLAGQDALLLDDLVKGGAIVADSTVLGMALAGRGRFAVLLVSTAAGVYAIRFDETGVPAPAKLTR